MSLLLTILVLGLLANLSPSTIVVFILLLGTTRARANAAAFLIGWGLSLIVVFAVSYWVGGAHDLQKPGGHQVVDAVEVLLGVGLVVVAARQWRRRKQPRDGSAMAKSLSDRMNRVNPVESTLVGVLAQPWTLTAAAAVVLVRHHSAAVVAVVAFAAFTVLSTATVGLMYLYYARNPGVARAHLVDLRDRVVRAGPAVFAVVALLVGLYLIVDGSIALAHP